MLGITDKVFNRFKTNYKVPSIIVWMIFLLCIIPFVASFIFYFSANHYNPQIYFGLNPLFFANLWIVFGITGALFTAILAFIDYKIRQRIIIPLFGILLLGTALLDIYYLIEINNTTKPIEQDGQAIYLTWIINRFYYLINLIIGSIYYLKTRNKPILSYLPRKSIMLIRVILFTTLELCLYFILLQKKQIFFGLDILIIPNPKIYLSSIILLVLALIWTIIILPRFILTFNNSFTKSLFLSAIPLIAAQILIIASTKSFDVYFNAALYLRFLSYMIPVVGILLSYVDTIRREKETRKNLDKQVIEKQLLTNKLQERETLLASAEQISNLGSWELEIATNTYKWSDQLYKIYGFIKADFHPTHAITEQLIVAQYRSKLNKELSYAVRNKGSYAIEYQIIKHQTQEIRYVLGQGHYEPKTHKLLGTVQDITELKEATQKLRKNEALLREAEALSNNGSWEWDSRSNDIYWSDELFNIFGILPYSMEITFANQLQFIHPDDVERVKRIFVEARKGHHSFTIDYRIIRPNQELRYLITTAKYKGDETGNHFIYLGNTQDVTIIREAERRLEEKINELNMSNKELEQFAYVASHDLQEPLRKIRAFGDLLKMNCSEQLDEEGKDYVDRMQNAAERMQTLINDLLTFSRATRDERVFVPVDLHELIGNVIKELDYTIEEANAIINFNVKAIVGGIAPQLAQVFQNILSNALKFTKAGVQPIIDIQSELKSGAEIEDFNTKPETNYHIITIQDNGVGFDETYADKIFEMFQRLHGRSEYKGTGIGLAICKKIVENHEGFIKASSIIGKGALFTIILPVTQQN